MNRITQWFFAILVCLTMAFQAIAQDVPQTQPQQPQPQQANPGVRVHVRDFLLIPPVPGQKARFTNGQVMVGAKEIFQTSFNGGFENAFASAKTRSQQEDAIEKFAPPSLLEKFREMDKESTAPLPEPEQYQPLKDPVQAMNIAVVKQPFVPFTHWGDSPFGEEAKTWQGLCSTYQDTMHAIIDRTDYPVEMKVEWIDTLGDACTNGLDERYTKVVDLVDWPLWQWTTGRTAGMVRAGRTPGVNVMYANGPALALYLFLRKSGVVVLHGFKCKGNPIIPFTIASFQVTKETTQPPSCVRLYNPDSSSSNAFKLGQSARYAVQLDNPSGVPFKFRYILTNKATGTSETVGENRPEVTIQFAEPGDFLLNVAGEYESKPIDSAPCYVEFSVQAPPPPPKIVVPPPPPPAPAPCPTCAAMNKTFRAGKDVVTLNVSDFVPRGTVLKPGTAKWTVDGSVASTDSSLKISTPSLNKKKQVQFVLEVEDIHGCVIRCEGYIKAPGSKLWILGVLAAVVVVVIVATHKGKTTPAPPVEIKTGQKPGDGH